MIDSLSFVNTHWFWYVVIAALLLWLVFAWKEWQQTNTSKLYLKLALAFVALASLTLIILKPLIVSKLDTYEMVVLTKGHDSNTLDSLKKANKKIQVQNYQVNEPFINPNKKPSSILILGEGLAPFDFYQIDSLNASYLGNHESTGIIKLHYEQEQVVGNPITIEGLYAKPEKGKKLVLENPAKTALDSVVFADDSTQIFKLSTQLNVIGNYEYSIVEKDSLGTILDANPIGISVVNENALRVLVINGFPTFETKYLKNYLAEKGHEIVVRSQVTQGKFKYEYFNLNTKPSVDFSEKSLQQYDLLIIDAQSFRNLGRNQKSNLEGVVRNDGLGVFVQPTAAMNGTVNYLADFSFQSDNNENANLEEWPKINVSKYPSHFRANFALQPIHKLNNHIFTAFKPLGNGSVGTSVFINTFELVLSGNTNVYQILWSETINALSKKQMPSVHWEANDHMAFKGEPFYFKIRTHINDPKVLDNTNGLIPLLNDIDNNSLWHGKTYPKKTGWQALQLEQDSIQVFHYFVADTSQWTSLKSYKTSTSNKRQFNSNKEMGESYTTQQPMPLIWLYVLFVLSMGYLWLEPKL